MDGFDGDDTFIGMDEVHSQLQAAYHWTAIFFQGVDIMVQDGFTL